jgi:hypothetical protein
MQCSICWMSHRPSEKACKIKDSQRIVYVNGVIELEAKSAEEVFQFFNVGQKRRKVGNTVLNAVFSRSHSIFTIRVVRLKNKKQQAIEKLQVSQLSLVDLADLCKYLIRRDLASVKKSTIIREQWRD